MKKASRLLSIIMVLLLTLSLAACSGGSDSAEEEGTEEEGAEEEVGMENPWHEAASLAEAADGAGIGSFDIAEEMELSLGKLDSGTYRYMAGLAEAEYGVAAVELTIRKGDASVAADGDISGDYTEYAYTWTQNIKGLEVTCYGNREGEATKTIWSLDGTCYAILAYGAGGDTDFGLSADDLNSLINGIQ